MKFSDYFKIERKADETWFDPILSVDTPLFLDPFLVYSQEKDHFEGSHSEIVSFFDNMFRLIARSTGNIRSPEYRKAVNDLLFPEVQELCLGYTDAGTKGSGSGGNLAEEVAAGLWQAIETGINYLSHFEEVSIIRAGIGPDRISDMTASLLRRRLVAYTTEICKKYRVPVQTVNYLRGYFDAERGTWVPILTELPRNPYSNRPLLLVPQIYLRPLTTINPDGFWEYCYDFESEILRHEFGKDITRHVPKETIIALALRHFELLDRYVKHVEESPAEPYDFESDPKGYVRWYDATKAYWQNHPLTFSVTSEADFRSVIDEMLEEYRHFVEENAGWQLLWNDNGTSKREKAAQLLLLGIVKHYCRANDIDISPEANIGRGPVDFKVAKGYTLRALIEVKLARNSKFWNGFQKQLPTYMNAEKVSNGYFVVIIYSDQELKKVSSIQLRIGDVRKLTGYVLKSVLVDASREKPSASVSL